MLRRRAAGILVTGVHGILAWLALIALQGVSPREDDHETPLEIRLLPAPEAAKRNGPPPRPQPGPRVESAPGMAESPATVPGREPSHASPSIDWESARQRVAVSSARAPAPKPDPDCDVHENPGSLRPRCDKPPRFDWNPQPKRVEFSGGLPFVRIGKRCAIGLGFMGCAVGHLPEANGHLFDGIKDPARPDSSVPDVPR